jgi:hypothetical protein
MVGQLFDMWKLYQGGSRTGCDSARTCAAETPVAGVIPIILSFCLERVLRSIAYKNAEE